MGSQIGEGIAVKTPGPDKQLKKCDWKNCDGKHETKLTYPKGGNVDRGGSALRDNLLAKNMEPWDQGGYGVPNKHMYNELGTLINRTPEFSYRTEAHHLIPVELMAKTKTLKKNAVLAKWDINAIENGSFHPRDDMDVAVHELQQHHGSHGGRYTSPIADELAVIEETYKTMCHGKETIDAQLTVVDELDALSGQALRKILAIRSGRNFWPLHANSLLIYKTRVVEYERRRKLHEKLSSQS
jgi:HNH/ENDO VII superfamily nuclease